MKNVCPHCGAPLSESESVCHACGGFIEAPVSEHRAGGPLRKIGKIVLSAGMILCLGAAPQKSSQVSPKLAEANITAPSPVKVNPVGGNQITTVTKPLYIIKEDDFAYTNIQWAIALCAEVEDYIPKDVPLLEPDPNNQIKISGSSISFNLAPLAGITPVIYTDLKDGKLAPSNVPDEEIEIVYGHRDGITLYGTITDYGTTKELDPDFHIYYGKYSGYYDDNRFTNNTVYYLNGTIDRVKNNIRTGAGFISGYKQTVYNHDGMFANVKKTHQSMITYPGLTQTGVAYLYNRDEMIGSEDVEYQAFSRFQILYFPDEDLFWAEIKLLDQGTIWAEGSDGKGRHEEDSAESDFIYNIIMLSDYKMMRDTEAVHTYMGDTYITVPR